MASSLRSIPSLRPPSRPKKQPSPRLTPRRSTEGKGGSGILSLESRLMGPENDVENCNSFGSLEGGASSPTDSKPLNGASMNITSSVPTSPLKSTPRSLARRERQLQHRQREEAATKEQQQQQQSHPMSPPTTIGEPLATLSPSLETENVDFVKSPVQNQQQSNRTTSDEDLAPLTPRNLVMEANGGAAEQAEFTLTPPVSSPTPLIVSAKRLGNEVRRGKNGAKRRRPLDEDSSTSSSSDDDDNKMMLPAEMSPTQRTQEYWRRCYGNTQLPQQLLNSQTSWSASRAAPAKSW